MQTIPSTFYAYAGSLAGRGITDPLANIYAAIRYTVSRYGSLGAWRQRGFKGYETGAWRTRNEWARLHAGEMVLPARVAGAVRGALGGGVGAGVVVGPVNVYASTVEEGRAGAKGFLGELARRRILTDARIA
jgi:hypothetical protein